MKKQYIQPVIKFEELLSSDALLASNTTPRSFKSAEDKVINDGVSYYTDLWSSIWNP